MSEAPRFAVLGAGGIGAYVGAALTRGGAAVTLIARGPHLAAMQRHGVEVHSPRGDFRVDVEATDDLDALKGADVVILAVKSWSIPDLAAAIGERLSPGAALVSAQNGLPWWYMRSLDVPFAQWHLDSVDPGGVIATAIADDHVVGCVTYCSAELVAPGVIRHVEGTRFAIGEPFGADGRRCQAIAQALHGGGLKCSIEQELNEQIWLKLIGSVAFNTVSAITGCTLGELGVLDSSRQLLRRLLEESAAVAHGLGIGLPVSIDRRLERGLAVGAHKPSTLQDLEAGKPLEVDCLSGAVLELADQLAIDVPCTRAVHTCLQLIDARRRAAPDVTTSPLAVGV